jgi:pimeloyl-ACP methyl ester carboxylesterase
MVNRKTLRGSLGFSCTPEQLGATGVPVLFLAGREDVLFPPDLVAGVQKFVRGSRYVELPDAGHSGYVESPALFNEAVLSFLAETGIR